MSRIVWDKTGEKLYETGVRNCVLYVTNNAKTGVNKPTNATGNYVNGVAWNGITGITESPSGADANDLYADDIKYLSLRAAETFGATVEAYTYPDEFGVCDGTAEIVAGVKIGQQERKTFGLCYRTVIGNDEDLNEHGYKLHLIYGATASPSEKGYQTINESPEAITFSWELSTTPVNVTGFKPTACITIDSTKVDAEKLAALEDILYGTDEVNAYLPLPDEVASIINTGSIAA